MVRKEDPFLKMLKYFVMLQMVAFESHGKRDADGEVCEHAQEPVGEGPVNTKPGTVGDLMDAQHQGMVDHTAK